MSVIVKLKNETTVNSKNVKNEIIYESIEAKNRFKSIISFLIKKSLRKYSSKTADTDINLSKNIDYDYKDIKKFDESNKSLSDISEFDLEGNDTNKSDFDSSEDEINEIDEGEKIFYKSKRTFINNRKKNIDDEFENQLEKDYEEIKRMLGLKKI